jgi:hypothetical protein
MNTHFTGMGFVTWDISFYIFQRAYIVFIGLLGFGKTIP